MNKLRLAAMLLGLLVLTSLSSCTKEGVYNPKMKIQRVYCSSTYTEKYLNQSWNWDGKLLKSIDHYWTGGTLSWTEDFTYDGKRLVRVDDYISSEYVTYAYDGKLLKSADYYYKGSLESSTAYTYDDGKLTKMDVTEYGAKKSKTESHLQNAILPFQSEVVKVVSKFMAEASAKKKKKDVYTFTLQFTWDGDNVSKLTATQEGYWATAALQYDSKNSPLKGFHSLYSDTEELEGMFNWSKNNVTKMIVTGSDGENEVIDYTYQYNDNDYPIMVIERYADEYEDYQFTTNYEYE